MNFLFYRYKLFYRDLLDKKGSNSAYSHKLKETYCSVSLSTPIAGDKDSNPIKAAYFIKSVLSTPFVHTRYSAVSSSRRKRPQAIVFSMRLSADLALSFLDQLILKHIPSILKRDGTYTSSFSFFGKKYSFSSKNLFDFDFRNKRYDFFNWKSPFYVHFQSPFGYSLFSLYKLFPAEGENIKSSKA